MTCLPGAFLRGRARPSALPPLPLSAYTPSGTTPFRVEPAVDVYSTPRSSTYCFTVTTAPCADPQSQCCQGTTLKKVRRHALQGSHHSFTSVAPIQCSCTVQRAVVCMTHMHAAHVRLQVKRACACSHVCVCAHPLHMRLLACVQLPPPAATCDSPGTAFCWLVVLRWSSSSAPACATRCWA